MSLAANNGGVDNEDMLDDSEAVAKVSHAMRDTNLDVAVDDKENSVPNVIGNAEEHED